MSKDLVPLIKKHVALGSIIHKDSWRAYSLANNGYTHKIVNHSDPKNPFIAPDGTYNQRIESTWRPLKDYFRSKRVPYYNFAEALVEYSWRRDCKKNGVDTFSSLLDIIQATYGV